MLRYLKSFLIFVPSKMHQHNHNPKSDIIGIISSGLCLVHCLAGPIMVLLGYSFIEPDGWHIWDFIFLIISAYAIFNVTRGHSTRWIKAGLWASFSVLSLSIFFSHDMLFFSVLSWLAAASLVVFHVLNLKHARECHVL